MSLAEKQAEQKQRVVDYFKALPVYKYAAMSAGISVDTLKDWRDKDKDFSDELQKAESEFYGSKVKKARPEFLLERLDKETFGLKTDESPVNVLQLIINKYGGSEGVINEVPRPDQIEGGSPQDSA